MSGLAIRATRRAILRAIPALSTAAILPAYVEAVAAEPAETPEQRLDRARKELIEATKAAYPDITDWRLIDSAANDRIVGMFMMLGHRDREAV